MESPAAYADPERKTVQASEFPFLLVDDPERFAVYYYDIGEPLLKVGGRALDGRPVQAEAGVIIPHQLKDGEIDPGKKYEVSLYGVDKNGEHVEGTEESFVIGPDA